MHGRRRIRVLIAVRTKLDGANSYKYHNIYIDK